jgi:MFS family permease
MALFPPMLGSIAEVVPRLEQVGPANGFMNLTNLVATLFAPWLFGVLLDAYGTGEGEGGYLWGYLLLALFALLGAIAGVVYVVSRRRAGRQAPEQPAIFSPAEVSGSFSSGSGPRSPQKK